MHQILDNTCPASIKSLGFLKFMQMLELQQSTYCEVSRVIYLVKKHSNKSILNIFLCLFLSNSYSPFRHQ